MQKGYDLLNLMNNGYFMNDICKQVGRNFARIRQEKHLTQKQIAEQLGIHSSYISALEHGHRNPKITKIIQLAQALGVSHIDFFRH